MGVAADVGSAVVITLIAVEAVLLVGGLAGWFDRGKVAPFVRIAVLVLFVALIVIGVIGWAPRYYLLAAWLLILGAWGVLSLYRQPRPSRRLRTGIIGVSVATVTFLAASPVLMFPEYTPIAPTGSLAVEAVTFTVTDSSRVDPFSGSGDLRWLTFEVWYPEEPGGPGGLPLIVFSHGSMGLRSSNQSMFEDLASHGYVVASIDHTGHALYSTGPGGGRVWIDSGYLGELRRENASENPEQSLEYYRKWMEVRMGDISFVLDYILAELAGPEFGQAFAPVDPARIGLVGHSLGGAAVLGVGRLRGDIGAVVSLEAPYMTEIVGVEEGRFSWHPDPYPVPVLNVYSDSAWGHLEDWPQYRRNLEMLDDPTASNLYMAGVGHLHLTDLALSSPFLTRFLNGHPSPGDGRESLKELNAHVLRFFDSELRGIVESRP